MRAAAEAVKRELTETVRVCADLEAAPLVKTRLAALARRIGLPIGRIRRYWYGEIDCPPAHEADLIRAYHRKAQKVIELRGEYEKCREDVLGLNPRIGGLLPPANPDHADEPGDDAVMAYSGASEQVRRRGAKR